MTPKQFCAELYPHALASQKKTGIAAEFTLAQAALETGWGKSAPGNMYFGIKAKPGEKRRQLLVTREVLATATQEFPVVISVKPILVNGKRMYEYRVKDWFREYDSPEESFNDHNRFFFTNTRYAAALQVRGDAEAFARAVAAAKYATDPDYAAVLVAVIQTVRRNLPKQA